MVIDFQKSPNLCWMCEFEAFDSSERGIALFSPKILQNAFFFEKMFWTRLWCGKLCGQAGGDSRLLGSIRKIECFFIFVDFSIKRLFTWGEWASICPDITRGCVIHCQNHQYLTRLCRLMPLPKVTHIWRHMAQQLAFSHLHYFRFVYASWLSVDWGSVK